MLFTEYNLISYLLTNCPPTKGGNDTPFLIYQDFVENKISAYEDKSPHRNNIFFVEEADNKGKYFLKQPKRLEQEFRQSVYTEANVYKNIPENIKSFFPNLIGFDLAHFLLICECINDNKNVDFNNNDHLKLLASTLKLIHKSFEDEIIKEKQKFEDFLVAAKPFILRLDKATIRALRDGLILIDELKIQEEVAEWLTSIENQEILAKIATKWTENTIIHQDLKSDNILIIPKDSVQQLKFLDWEMAVIGDNYWDLASILYQILINDINEKLDLKSDFESSCEKIFKSKAVIFQTYFSIIYFGNTSGFDKHKLTAFTGSFILLKNTIGDEKHYKFAFEILKNIELFSTFFNISENGL